MSLDKIEARERADHSSSLPDLLAKVEGASGHDTDLDLAIFFDLDPQYEARRKIQKAKADNYPAYSASLDDALALVERVLPGWVWEIRTWRDGRPEARLCEFNVGDQGFEADGATPALALLSAMLRALISGGEHD